MGTNRPSSSPNSSESEVASAPRNAFSEIQIYEKIRIGIETPLRNFLTPYQIGPESTSELNLLRMDDFLPGFVTAANKFTDTCCQNLVKVIRASSESASIRETPTPELAKRIRDTSFAKLDEVLAHINSTAKKVEILHENIAKLKEEVERSTVLETIGVQTPGPRSSSGSDSDKDRDPAAAVDEENARLLKVKMAAFAKIIEYLKLLRELPESAMSYACGKCFGAEIDYELEREQVAEIKKQTDNMVAMAIGAFERAAGAEQNQLQDYKSRVAAAKEESAYFAMLQKALEEKMESRQISSQRFRKLLLMTVLICLAVVFILFTIVAFRMGIFSTKVR